MQWRVAEAPRPFPSSPAETLWVEQALLTAHRTGQIRVIDRDWRWVLGAVYDKEGSLVPQSQRDWDREEGQPAPVDPEAVWVPRQVDRSLEGSWAFGGHWARHFGHFLLETLTNLWAPEALTTSGVVFLESAYLKTRPRERRGMYPPTLGPWQAELMELAGFGSHELLVSRTKPARVERLLVAERPVFLNQWVRPEAATLWRRISEAVGKRDSATKVFLSRSRFNAETGTSATGELRTDSYWDALLDSSFARAGYEVVHPEDLSIREQIALVRGAEILAGSSGSALHLSCFAEPGTRVLEVGDLRTGQEPLRTQRAIDAACGHQVAYIGYADADALAGLPALTDSGAAPGRPSRWQRLRLGAAWRWRQHRSIQSARDEH